MKRFVARKSRRITVKFLVLLFLFIFMTLTIVRYMFISSFEIDSVKANYILSSTVRMPKNKLSIFDFGTVDAFLKDNFKNLNKVIIKREAKLSENIKNASALGEPLIYIYNTHQTFSVLNLVFLYPVDEYYFLFLPCIHSNPASHGLRTNSFY